MYTTSNIWYRKFDKLIYIYFIYTDTYNLHADLNILFLNEVAVKNKNKFFLCPSCSAKEKKKATSRQQVESITHTFAISFLSLMVVVIG